MALCLAFVRLLRFSDFALVNLAFIYWMGDKGFAFKIGRRKNDQTMIFTDWDVRGGPVRSVLVREELPGIRAGHESGR